MSSLTPEPLSAAIITISDSCARGERTDLSGPAVAEVLRKHHFTVVGTATVPDDHALIQEAILSWIDRASLVVTTGGTGLAPRDVTPEATRAICDRLIEGVPERMRSEGAKKTPLAALSRAICGVRGGCVILNLPGSPAGAAESLESVIDLMPHALQLVGGNTQHE
jgi:molybdopterin adenylyltransferase